MEKVLQNLQKEFASIRSLRAHPSLLENLKVEIYSQSMLLKNVASISVQDTNTLLVTVWDQSAVQGVDKGIRNSNMGFNPRIEGNKLYIHIPPITTERRHEFIKIAKEKAENARISIRSIRRQFNDEIKEKNKSGEISEDIQETSLKKIQQTTDSFSEKIDHSLKEKEKDLVS
ncbi:ribosome-recycling factor-like [Ylistrum balloti]|uniref:ribosome-recycling factor-like n=1 Tax=Ylistrum balloti TaxID=509963 RepID=UPI002905BC17|nr:ribosome-recycling factor-like [Ylistrum balloti]